MTDEIEPASDEYPESWWYRVYAAVIIVTVLVIALLGAFTRYFS